MLGQRMEAYLDMRFALSVWAEKALRVGSDIEVVQQEAECTLIISMHSITYQVKRDQIPSIKSYITTSRNNELKLTIHNNFALLSHMLDSTKTILIQHR